MLPADAQVHVIVRFRQEDHQRIVGTQLDKPIEVQRTERSALVASLRQASALSQQGVRAFLSQPEVAAHVREVHELWIVNALALSASPDVIRALASRSDVVEVTLDEWKRWIAAEDVPGAHLPLADPGISARTPLSTALEARIQAAPPAPGETTWSVAKIGADRVWRELGVTGSGVVVANIDTGVDWNHPALKNRYRGWNGGPVVDHLHNWFDATNEASVYPSDLNGHGTHTMGTIVGEGGIGVAPGARWMAAKGLNGQGFGFYSWLLASMQFMLAPNGNPTLAPHILSNSWGAEDGNDTTLQSAVRALRAAGIFVVFANGNRGPNAGTVGSPASLPEAIAVGATDSDDDVARFSSRGPSPFGQVRPHLVAPGVGVVSTFPGGAYVSANGTSMATPHVAGIAALLLSAQPMLNITATLYALTHTAKPLSTTLPNNESGWGRVDAYRAVLSVMSTGAITGQVLHLGQPISGAQVVAHNGTHTPSTTTDAQGRYAILAPPGIYTVTANAFGYVAMTSPPRIVLAGQAVQQNFALSLMPSGVVRGVVTDALSGQALTQTLVRALGTPVESRADVGPGYYVLNLPTGIYTLEARLNGYRVHTQVVTVQDGVVIEAHFTLTPTQRILLVDTGAWYYGSTASYYRRALDDLQLAYDELRVKQLPRDTPTLTTLLRYDTVIWSAPFDSPGYIGAGEVISQYLASGRNLLISGQDIAFFDGFYTFQPYFSRLNAFFAADEVPSRYVVGTPGTLLAGRAFSIAGGDGANNQGLVDVVSIRNLDYGTPIARYNVDLPENAWAGVYAAQCLPYRSAFYSFGIEAIDTAAERAAVISRTLAAFEVPRPLFGVALAPQLHPNFEIPVAPPGGVITHAVRVRHIGEVGSAEVFTLSLAGGQWSAQISPTAVTLSPCATAWVTVTVTVPATATWDALNVMTLTATSSLSPTFSASVALRQKTPRGILLVDDDRFFDREADYLADLAVYGNLADRWSTRGGDAANSPPLSVLQLYPLVIWFNAYDWFDPISNDELTRLGAYLEGGGRLLFTSQAALHLRQEHSAVSRYLGVAQLNATDATSNVFGVPAPWVGSRLVSGTLLTGPNGRFPYNWNLSASVQPIPRAQIVLRGDSGQPFGLAHERTAHGAVVTSHLTSWLAPASWRAAVLPFALETLTPSVRGELTNRLVGWLSWLGESSLEADRAYALPGEPVTFTVRAQLDAARTAPITAHVALSAQVSGGAEVVASTLGNPQPPHGAGDWAGALTSGQSQVWVFVVTTPLTLPAGSAITATAFFSLEGIGIRFARQAAVRVGGSHLTTALVLSPSAPSWGGWVTATAFLTNIGGASAPSAVLDVVVPTPLQLLTRTVNAPSSGTVVSASNRVRWLGALAPGEGISLTYVFTLPAFSPMPGAYYHAVMAGNGDVPYTQSAQWIEPPIRLLHLPAVRRP